MDDYRDTVAVLLHSPLGLAVVGAAAVLAGMRAEEALRLRRDDFGLGEVIY